METKPLQITVDWRSDYMLAIEFGEVCDGRPDSLYRGINDEVAWVLREPEGEVIGFIAHELAAFDPSAVDGLWEGPRFDVPVLGLDGALAGEIAASALATFAHTSTTDAEFFHMAVASQDEDGSAEYPWRLCLGAGNLKAHFGLGYTLSELGRHHEAYRHLRRYTELTPYNAWAWCWYGRACIGLGETAEARQAFERALVLQLEGSFETDAAELLDELAPE